MKVSLKPNHYAVYVLDETTDLYGDPVAERLDMKTAWAVAEAVAEMKFPGHAQRCDRTRRGFVRRTRSGSPSLNVIIWDMADGR